MLLLHKVDLIQLSLLSIFGLWKALINFIISLLSKEIGFGLEGRDERLTLGFDFLGSGLEVVVVDLF